MLDSLDILSLLVGGVIGAVIPPAYNGTVALIHIARHGWGPSPLPTRWTTAWSFDGTEQGAGSDRLDVKTFGPWFWGKGTGAADDYTIRGRHNAAGHLSGKWRSVRPGRRWAGTFMMCLDTDGSTATGHWIGTIGRNADIKAGRWTWTAGSPSTPRAS